MNEFNKKLAQAKKRQRKVYLFSAVGLLVVLLIVVVGFIVSRGTRVEVFPEEAREKAELSVSGGAGFSVGDTVYSLASSPEIKISSPGFKVGVFQIPKERLGSSFKAELFELPGRLIAYTTFSDMELAAKTSWFIDDKKADMGGSAELELEAGVYKLTVEHPYFEIEEAGFEIFRDQDTEVEVSLKPAQGNLEINSIPEGAKVFIGKEEVGVTPFKREVLAGEFDLRVSADNYIDIVDTIEVTRKKDKLTRNYRMKLKQAKVIAELQPTGGVLLLDGVRVDENPVSIDATVEHKLVYMKPGYYPVKQMVLLEADEEKHLQFYLKQEVGKVTVSSTPKASVSVAGKNYGVTPVTLTLSAVPHKITLKKEGYRTATRTVTPRGQSAQKVNVRLVSETQAKLQEAPIEYKNKAGITLKLFKPNTTFVMGAPRSEKGQRANEFQRKVKLTKPFYASVYEVTNREFAKFNSGKSGGANSNPVTNVNWQEVAKFCNWLSQKEKLTPFYQIGGGYVTGFNTSADGYRLLSEAEWEWLARLAGRKSKTLFTWGDSSVIPPNTVNVADESAKGQVRFYVPRYTDGYGGVAPVGSFVKESSGLYDLGGNVSEWVHDVYSINPPKAGAVSVNPLGDQRGNSHVVKGPNFRSGNITTLRPAFREGLTNGRDDLGFRIGRYLYGGKNE